MSMRTPPQERNRTEDMESILRQVLRLPKGLGREHGRTHDLLQARLHDMGKDLGFHPLLEYEVGFRPDGRAARIDVAFFRDPSDYVHGWPLHAFEIDYNPKGKSVEKLLELPVTATKWIIVFSERPREGSVVRVPKTIRVVHVSRD